MRGITPPVRPCPAREVGIDEGTMRGVNFRT